MRTLPAGWPDPNDPNQHAPTVYLHVLDDVWPPASVQDGESLPAGWSQVGEFNIDCDLDAPLMPGQVNSGVNFTIATGSCTIPQPPGGLLAPWRAYNERTPASGHCELIASHDGYDGSTAFVLGKFLLDPIKGKVSEPFLSLSLIQDLVRLRKPHDLPTVLDLMTGPPGPEESPTRWLEVGAANNGYALDSSADFESRITSSYFPLRTQELVALQTIVGANLGALFLSMDGTTIVVKDPDYLLGTGDIDQTVNAIDSFDDLSWSQDPNAIVDRIEVSYVPPRWGSPVRIYNVPNGKTFDLTTPGQWAPFDPGTAIAGGGTGSSVNVKFIPTGVISSAAVNVFETSSGQFRVGFGVSDLGKYEISGPAGGTQPVDVFGNMAKDEDAVVVTWGESTEDATNPLTFVLGRQIEREEDALAVLDRIVTRVTSPSYVIDDVRVVPDVRRELADMYRVDFPEGGLSTRAMVTGIKLSGGPGGLSQSLTIAALGLIVLDFDEAWDTAHPGATLDDFDAVWDAAFPGATIDDFDSDPLKT